MLTPQPVRLYAQLILGVDLKSAEVLRRLLELFGQVTEFAPTHWATRGGPRDPFSAEQIQKAVESAGDDGIVPRVIRALPPMTYTAEWYQCPDGPFLSAITIESGDALVGKDAKLFVDFVDSIASAFPIEWGHIDMRQARQAPETFIKASGSYDHSGYYLRVGPMTVFPVTYLGTRLLNLVPALPNLLAKSGCPLVELGQGGFRFDLMPEPWNQDALSLIAAQKELLKVIDSVGLFAREMGARDLPGAAWLSPTKEDYGKS